MMHSRIDPAALSACGQSLGDRVTGRARQPSSTENDKKVDL
jgi:hypothetical protein